MPLYSQARALQWVRLCRMGCRQLRNYPTGLLLKYCDYASHRIVSANARFHQPCPRPGIRDESMGWERRVGFAHSARPCSKIGMPQTACFLKLQSPERRCRLGLTPIGE